MRTTTHRAARSAYTVTEWTALAFAWDLSLQKLGFSQLASARQPQPRPGSSLHESCNESIAAKLDKCHEKIPTKDKPIASALANAGRKQTRTTISGVQATRHIRKEYFREEIFNTLPCFDFDGSSRPDYNQLITTKWKRKIVRLRIDCKKDFFPMCTIL